MLARLTELTEENRQLRLAAMANSAGPMTGPAVAATDGLATLSHVAGVASSQSSAAKWIQGPDSAARAAAESATTKPAPSHGSAGLSLYGAEQATNTAD